MPARVPSYRLHKSTGQAVVTISGRDFYLGKHGTEKSRAEYNRLIIEHLTRPTEAPRAATSAGVSLNEVMVGYLRFADQFYQKNGRPTGESASIRYSLRPLKRLYGHTQAREFGPMALKAVRQSMIDDDLCRNEINKRIGRIVRMFRWGVENEIVEPHIHAALKAVATLKAGRSTARESKPVKPVSDDVIEMTLPHLHPMVLAMVRLQRLTGMRPGEVCAVREADLEMDGPVWIFTPSEHKAQHHGKVRRVGIGPRAQEILRAWLRPDPEAYVFDPRVVLDALAAERRLNRQSPMTPSQRSRSRKPNAKRAPGPKYTTRSYYHVVYRACLKGGIDPWHPNQLRHAAATELRREFGLDAARAVLGHSSPSVTEVYAERDHAVVVSAMNAIG